MQFGFIVCPSQGLPKYIETEVPTLDFTSNKAFLKNRKGYGTSLSATFSA